MPRPTRRTRRNAAAEEQAAPSASPEPIPAPQVTSRVSRKSTRGKASLAETSTKRDTAMQELSLNDVLTTSSSTGLKDADAAATADTSVELGRKAQATPAHQQRRDTTGLDLEDEMFSGLDDSFGDDSQGGADFLIQAPPSGQRSNDTSSLTASIFSKRRGRAPSISLHGNDSAPIRPASRTGSTPAIGSSFNISNFKRRARQPSILGTAQKGSARKALQLDSDPPALNDNALAVDDDDDEDEEDFMPEAESTPLNRRSTRSIGGIAQTEKARESVGGKSTSTRSRKRKSGEALPDEEEAGERPEKVSRVEVEATQESEAENPDEQAQQESRVEVEASQPPVAQVEQQDDDDEPPALSEDEAPGLDNDDDDDAEAMAQGAPDMDMDARSDSTLSDLPSPDLPPLMQPPAPSTPTNQATILAPPESSGSEDEEWLGFRGYGRNQQQRNKRGGGPATPTRAQSVSDLSSPPSLTHSPNLAAAARGRGRQAQQPSKKRNNSPQVKTADLANLLPRRRAKKRTTGEDEDEEDHSSDAEIDASGLGQDEDEIGTLDARAARRRRNAERRIPAAPEPSTTTRSASASANNDTNARNARTSSRRRRRTYGRRSSSNDNEDDVEEPEADETAFAPAPDDTFDNEASTLDEGAEVPEELRKAVKKFEEVDQWEMEFEEMTQSSSPHGGR